MSALIALVPWAVAVGAGVVAAQVLLGPADSLLERVAGVLVGVTVSTVVLIGVERAARRLLPLVMLLRLSLTFPDRAPSRLAIALRAGNLMRRERIGVDAAEPVTAQEQAERLLTLVAALNTHDRRTRGHSERVRAFTDLVAEEIGLAPEDANRLRWAALLHDIGKLEVPTTILNKRGALNEIEHAIITEHPDAGARLAGPLAEWLGEWRHAIDQHHEKFDGTGYPRQLSGYDISEAGRIVAVTDAFETMTAVRSYKKASSVPDAREELVRGSGTHFDPDVVRAFLAISLPRLYRVIGPLAIVADIPVLVLLSNAGARALQGAAIVAAPAVAGAIAFAGSSSVPATALVASNPPSAPTGAPPTIPDVPGSTTPLDPAPALPNVDIPLPTLPANALLQAVPTIAANVPPIPGVPPLLPSLFP